NDYVLSTGTNLTVTIPAGTNSVAINVSPIDDPAEEAIESITLRLLPRSGYTLGLSEDTIYIFSDDGTLQFASPDIEIPENIGLVVFIVYRTGSTNLPV